MKAPRIKTLVLAGLIFQAIAVFALSTRIGRDINFPKDFDPAKAKAIRRVIQDEQFKFVDGIVSHWEPDFGTRLSFEGDTASLNDFLNRLRQLPGMGLRIILYRGRNDELRRDSAWQLDFSQARPDQVAVYLNLNATTLDFEKVKLPDWPPNPNSSPASAQK
jgi:hypothetical protein